ncbi:hypothetical protein [Legionella erythra]|uniref:Uncharacterized protein n=1 Tax=Legionella erythra TaxID=448 RepID=A0A0W0TUQ9_LEGER|nr:hypothetical protein [Legionella erythra]KTC99098.1 hypothetical protein Lery_0637 [Legionella erythra]
MHYSDTYQLIKKLKNKELANDLKQSLKDLEKSVNNPNFVSFLKKKQQEADTRDVFALRRDYDQQQFDKVIAGIQTILEHIDEAKKTNTADRDALNKMKAILLDIKQTASEQKQKETGSQFYTESEFYSLAKRYATHYLPFCQSSDPFKGSDFGGYCWGHTHHYGRLVSQGLLNDLSEASNKKLYRDFKQNWTVVDILFRRIGWYFKVSLEEQIRQAIWNALKDLDDQSTFNFNFLVDKWGFHSTSLRMVGDGIEYYENNYGVVKFPTREAAVNFLASYLLAQAEGCEGKIAFITVYKLPYTNQPDQDLFQDLPLAKLEKATPSLDDKVEHSQQLTAAIEALKSYIKPLRQQGAMKGRIKANELAFLCEELKSFPAEQVKARVEGILATKEHSLMLNRGSGFYLFKTGFKSHSTTETLLRDIVEAAEKTDHVLQLPSSSL